jgi:hypothetical protein
MIGVPETLIAREGASGHDRYNPPILPAELFPLRSGVHLIDGHFCSA